MEPDKKVVEETRFSFPESVINKVLEYLGTKPYVESAGLIVMIQQNAVKIESPIVVPEAIAETSTPETTN